MENSSIQRMWLSVRESANFLGINKKSMYSLISKGEISHSRRSGVGIRVHVDKLDEFMREGEVKSIKKQLERGG